MNVGAKFLPAIDAAAVSVQTLALSRRTFLVGTGAAAIAVGFGGPASTVFAQDTAAAGITSYVTIEPSGKITILYAKAEMGQGVLTGLPIIVAEFMDANWVDVAIERAAGVGPINANTQNTVASGSTSGQWTAMRQTGLQVRAVLLENAAGQLGVPVGELTTEPSVVVHAASGRRLTYGQIVAAGVTVPTPLPTISTATLNAATNPDNFRLMGRDNLVRVDVASKVNGTAVFGIDTDLPGMLYAAMLRPPVQGESPVTVDDTAAKAVPGVVAVVSTPDGVGVIAESYHAATRGVAQLALASNVTWTDTALARTFNSEQALTDGLARLAEGDLPAAFANAVRVETLTFRSNFVAHAPMEPINATVLAKEDGSFEVWVSTQTPGNVVTAVRNVAGGGNSTLVAINVTLLGGGFGRRIEAEVATDATYLAIAVRGRPVKLIWSRTDDLRFDPFRPLAVQRIDAGLDANNNIVAWRNRITTQAYGGNYSPATRTVVNTSVTPPANGDVIVSGGAPQPYGIPTQAPQYTFMPTGIKVGAWRAIGAAYQKWSVEAMLDRIAELRGEDVIAYRLSLLDRSNAAAAAAARITEMARDMSGWTSYQAPPGRALGFGYSNAVGSHTACVAEVSANAETGAIDVHKVWIAIDCGIAILPKHVEAQMVSNVLFALSPTLFEYVPIVNGQPQVANFTNYRTIRQDETPEIVVQVAPRGGAGTGPGGVGEAGVPPLLPAVAGAVRKALGGVHVGYVPMLPAKVLEAVAAARAPTTTA